MEKIARLAESGNDVSRFFTNTGSMMGPFQRVNVDFTSPMLQEDTAAKDLNISRQELIKTLIRQAVDQRYLASALAKKCGGLRVQVANPRRFSPLSSKVFLTIIYKI
jgi:hypothetical protein